MLLLVNAAHEHGTRSDEAREGSALLHGEETEVMAGLLLERRANLLLLLSANPFFF